MFFYIPEKLQKTHLYNAELSKHFVKIRQQTFREINSVAELLEYQNQNQNKTILSFSENTWQKYIHTDAVHALQESELSQSEPVIHSTCNYHILSPVYSATNKFLGTGFLLLTVGVPTYVTLPIAFIGASCNFLMEYHFIAASANGPKELDLSLSEQTLSSPTWKDELLATASVISSLAEGAGFAVGVYVGAAANNLNPVATYALSAIAFKFCQGRAMQSSGQKIFIEKGLNFNSTTVGKIANLTQQIPWLFDFNSWIRDFLPALESLLPAMAFNAFLNKRIDNAVLAAALSVLVSTGEWYQQRGYSVNLIKHVQELADTKPPLGFPHLVDIIIRFYNESIGNIVNGRFVNDAIGIVIPPAIWMLINKMAGNFFTGYVGGGELLKLIPAIFEKMNITVPENMESAAPIVQPILGAICALAAISQYTAGYDKNLQGLPIGIKPLLSKVYANSSLTSCSSVEIQARYEGWKKHMTNWPHRLFNVFNQAKKEVKTTYPCYADAREMDDEMADQMEKGYRPLKK
jgi:hypothetical protein